MKKYLIILFIITGNFMFVMSMNANPFIRQDTNKFKKSYVWVDFGFQIGNAKNWFDNYRSNYVVGHTVNLNYISNNNRFVKLRLSCFHTYKIKYLIPTCADFIGKLRACVKTDKIK